MRYLIIYEMPLPMLYVWAACIIAGQGGLRSGYPDGCDDEVGFASSCYSIVNPQTGMLMLDGIGGVDTSGYTFGSGPED